MTKRYYVIKKKKKIEISTDMALIFIAIFLLTFIISMEVMYYICRSVPDSLIVGVLGSGGTECICCVFIYLIKQKYKSTDDLEEVDLDE